MTKIKTTFASAVAIAAFAIAPLAYASTISYAPASVSVTEGQTFSVGVSVDPGAEKAYGVQLEATFPSDAIEATGMTLESGWISPASPSITAGKLTQMAGVGGGFSTKKMLGTISFKAKKAGTATIAVADSSIVSNAQGANMLAGSQGTSVVTVAAIAAAPAPALVLVAPAPAPQVPKQTTENAVTAPATGESESAGSQATAIPEVIPEGVIAQPAAAALADIGGFSTTSMILIGLTLLVIVGGLWFWRRERSQI